MTSITTVPVSLAGRSYDIMIGAGLIDRAGEEIVARLAPRRAIIVSDENVAVLYLDRLSVSLRNAGVAAQSVVVSPGEVSKDIQRFPALAERLLDAEPDRKSIIIALGGGVVGDLAGFAAATIMRGIDFVQLPTSLLAQVDSSVGGKTGVNARQGKNLVGAFHQPRLVLADLETLQTLPHRELMAGYAEMVKYGVLGDHRFFEHLEREGADLLSSPLTLAPFIAHCCRMKAEIVGEDEREAGRRALLNLGHTFGHAFEAETGFGDTLLHGESVSLGMVLAASLSQRLGRCAASDRSRIENHLASVGLPTRMADVPAGPFSTERLIQHMRHDKKAVDGQLTFIVLDRIGEAKILSAISEEEVRKTLIAEGAVL